MAVILKGRGKWRYYGETLDLHFDREANMLVLMPQLTAFCKPGLAKTLGLACTAALGFLVATPLDAAPTGQEIYQSLCAECHGAQGEGVPGQYEDPLHGDRTLEDLARVIDETMPEGEPEKCAGDQAKQVAEYLYQTFYTQEARTRLKPPRIELSRMTVRQYLNAAADLAGTFAGQGKWDDQHGLKGEYFNDRGFRRDKRVLERVDAQIDFDFGEKSPLPGKIGEEQFAIQWRGGVLADETGDYEFVLQTDNGARLWVNDEQRPLIDAWVQSGDDTQHRQTIRLLGGRAYPIRLDLSKSSGKTARVSLQWQPPHRVLETIPQRKLSPNRFPPVLVVNTEFPADDSSMGYERGISVSQAWDQATTYAAIEIANRVGENLAAWAKCPEDAPDRAERLKDFCGRFAETAFRRPLDDDQRRFFVDAQFDNSADLELSVKRAVLLILKSPRFLYGEFAPDQPDAYHTASRLSFTLWDSLPDAELLRAASQDQLQTPEAITAQATRMLADPRTRSKLRYFFHQWLQVQRAYDTSKDPKLFPDFEPPLVADAFTSLDLLLDDVIWSPASDFRQLFLADGLFVNRRLADFYGLASPDGDSFQQVVSGAELQSGVLTHPYLMLGLAYHKSSSPIHRGVFLVRSVLGRSLKPPPIAVAPLDEGFDPTLTTRDRVAMQTKAEACQTCHRMINPLGFSLENYDAVGRFRTHEQSKPVDASGSYTTLDGQTVEFTGARQLAGFLAESPEVRRSFVQQLFHNLVKQPINAYDYDAVAALQSSFAGSDCSVQRLIVQIATVAADHD